MVFYWIVLNIKILIVRGTNKIKKSVQQNRTQKNTPQHSSAVPFCIHLYDKRYIEAEKYRSFFHNRTVCPFRIKIETTPKTGIFVQTRLPPGGIKTCLQ
jgi:hypothetical protein